jgi:5-bromo-4-chloroindolyl phosphate hydrolysis protein
MATSPRLVRFVVGLVVDDDLRERFYGGDEASRDQMMVDAGLSGEERRAIKESDANALEKILNIQIVVPMAKKRKARKAKAAKKGGRAAKKSAKKASKKSAKKAAKKR